MLTLTPSGMYNHVNMSEFEQLLADNGWKRADLARALGLTPTTLSRWKDKPPRYALAYLRLRAGLMKVMRGEV